MKPKGLVSAAPITSQTSMPMRSKITFSSFTRAMFTERKMFSRSLADSATRALDTGTTRSSAAPYSAAAACGRRRVRAAHDLGDGAGGVVLAPGSSRSGEKARKKSLGVSSPLRSQDLEHLALGGAGVGGRFQHHQLPGPEPLRDARVRSRGCRSMSGSRCGPSGVGTQMTMAWHSRRSPRSVVAMKRSFRRAAATRSGPMCRMYDSPRVSAATLAGSRSKPMTGNPASQKTSASGSPT